MRSRIFFSTLFTIFLLSVPSFVRADEPVMGTIVSLPGFYPIGPYGAQQTAGKTGDMFDIFVNIQDSPGETFTADLSGISLIGTSTSEVSGPYYRTIDGIPYQGIYFYNLGNYTLPTLADGLKTIGIHGLDTFGNVIATTTSFVVDNALPTATISDVSFASSTLQAGDSIFISGKMDGTGTVAHASGLELSFNDKDGNPILVPNNEYPLRVVYDATKVNDVLASDGTFSNAAVQVEEYVPDLLEQAGSVNVTLTTYDEAANQASTTYRATIPRVTVVPPDPCSALGACVSNVLFLPGIESSRLYRPDYAGGTDKLWEPNVDSDVKDLYMNTDGTSERFDVYTKEKDVLDELPDGENIYKSFIAKMNGLKTEGTINDWEPIAYDWRLSLDDILTYGNDVDGRIYYSGDLRATSTPYLVQELRHLAATSKTGKVTLVAHSNGGLLAKRLTEILGPAESAVLIDKMIFVAVPQVGTPAAIAAGLHGYDQDHIFGLVTSKATARTLAQNAPMEYQLLPSEKYFSDVSTPVITFDGALADWISKYGDTIQSESQLRQFLVDSFGRVDPQVGSTAEPIQLNDALLTNAETIHAGLDAWVPPTGVSLVQIAGWGVPKTVSGITYKKKGSTVTPEAQFTIDGDGTVVVPSALWTSATTSVENYWLNLKSYNKHHSLVTIGGLNPFNHGNILETDPVLNFISDNITNVTKPISDYSYFSVEAPSFSEKRLQYSLHSPLTLNLYDAEGRHTGVSTSTGQIEEQIPGTYYTEFGEVKYIFTDSSSDARIIMDGYDAGTFTFTVDEYQGEALAKSTSFKDVPTTANTLVSLSVEAVTTNLSDMVVDEMGDGSEIITLTPVVGEVVEYVPPAPEPTLEPAPTPVPDPVQNPEPTSVIPTSSAVVAPAGSISIPVIVPTVPNLATTTLPADIATSTALLSQVAEKAPVRKVNAIEKKVREKPSEPVVLWPPKEIPVESVVSTMPNFSQPAAVYEASKQSSFKLIGKTVYNGIRDFFFSLKNIFH